MKINKNLLAGGAITAIGLASIIGISTTNAAPSSNHTSIVEKIAQTFNLNKDDVQSVFDEEHKARMKEHQKEAQERLATAVTEGKITQEQADAITAKREEMKTFMESLKDSTEEQRKEAMKNKTEELKTWAQDNNIPIEYLRPEGPGMHGMKGMHKGFGRGHMQEREQSNN